MFNTPILFLIFNRPDLTKQVFDKIREIKPLHLFIAADGPRGDKYEDQELCRKTKEIVSLIDWECEIKTLFRDENLGCGRAVSEAISWFFEHVEEGIILEDDCLPSSTFFNYCEILLEKYRWDNNIMHIGGTNFQNGIKRGNADYYFSKIPHYLTTPTKIKNMNLKIAKKISSKNTKSKKQVMKMKKSSQTVI